MATGRPDTQWQTGPWADRTNAITPHSAHGTAAQNTAISYLSRQLCLRRRIEKRELAFHHTNASLGTERNDKHVTDLTRISLRRRWPGKFHIVFVTIQGQETTLMFFTRYQAHSLMSWRCQKRLVYNPFLSMFFKKYLLFPPPVTHANKVDRLPRVNIIEKLTGILMYSSGLTPIQSVTSNAIRVALWTFAKEKVCPFV